MLPASRPVSAHACSDLTAGGPQAREIPGQGFPGHMETCPSYREGSPEVAGVGGGLLGGKEVWEPMMVRMSPLSSRAWGE